jgi:gastrin-releasing peptide receptor
MLVLLKMSHFCLTRYKNTLIIVPQLNMSLAAVVITIRPPWSLEAGMQQGAQVQQESTSVTSDTAASQNASKTNPELDSLELYLNPHSSEMYVAYTVEYGNPLDNIALSETDTEQLEPLLSNQSVVFPSIPTEDFIDKLNESKIDVKLQQPQNKFKNYENETEELNDITSVLDEATKNTPLSIVFIPINNTENENEEFKELLHDSNLKMNSSNRYIYTHIRVQNTTDIHNKTKTKDLALEHISWRKSKEYKVLRHYLDPAVYLLIFVVGVLGNGMILFLFIRHRELRTAANVMIINLVVCDILNLSINAPLHSYFHYEGGSQESLTSCRTVLALRQSLRCTGALAVIALIIQRFSIIRNSSVKHWTPFKFTVLSIITVWVLPLAIAWPTMYSPEFYEPVCFLYKEEGKLSYAIVLNFVLYCILMPILMFGFSSNIAIRLKRSVKDIPGEIRHRMQEQMRTRSARMMIALAIVFVITYFPFQIWVLLARWVRLNKQHPIMIFALYLSKQLLFANGCFNPIALFIVSSAFRRLFVRYLCCRPKQRVYSTKL